MSRTRVRRRTKHLVAGPKPPKPKKQPKGKPTTLGYNTSGAGNGSKAQGGIGNHGSGPSIADSVGDAAASVSHGVTHGIESGAATGTPVNVPGAGAPASAVHAAAAAQSAAAAAQAAHKAAVKERRQRRYQAALRAYDPNYSSEGRDYKDPADKIAQKTIEHAAKEKATPKQAVEAVRKATTKLGYTAQAVTTANPERVQAKAEAIVRDYVSHPEKSQLRPAPKPKAVRTAKPVVAADKKTKIRVARKLYHASLKGDPKYGTLDPDQANVLTTVLDQGKKAGATRKAMLSATEAGLVESNLANLDYGDADSQGWRQERTSIYGTGPKGPTNVKASAKRYFDEAAAAQTKGQTAGELAQATQQSAFPDRYDEVKASAKPLLKAYLASGGKEEIPPKLLVRAKSTIGPVRTRKLTHGKAVTFHKGKGSTDKDGLLEGRYAGSKALVQELVGSKVRGDHGGTKHGEAPDVHSAEGDHYREDGYAQDLNGDNPRENEPAYTQESLDEIVANIKKAGYEGPDPTGLKIGENWEGRVGGYDVQLLTNEGGTINHIHIGAHPAGESSPLTIGGTTVTVGPKPVSSVASGSTTAGGTVGGSTGTLTASGTPVAKGKSKGKQAVRRRGSYKPAPLKKDEEGGYYSVDGDDYELDPYIARLIAAA